MKSPPPSPLRTKTMKDGYMKLFCANKLHNWVGLHGMVHSSLDTVLLEDASTKSIFVQLARNVQHLQRVKVHTFFTTQEICFQHRNCLA